MVSLEEGCPEGVMQVGAPWATEEQITRNIRKGGVVSAGFF
jgi:hypothetical protein